MSEFGAAYAGVYDALYRDKDYAAECQAIRDAFTRFSQHAPASVLDLGCGSGSHALPLAAAGFSVTGVDRSDGMLTQARRKAVELHLTDAATFVHTDIRACNLGKTFDAALMMFAVLGYQVENSDVLAALVAARRHLETGGLFLFDCWYGPAVLSDRPSNRVKTVDTQAGPLTRFTSSALDLRRHTCRIHFRMETGSGDFDEDHTVRFFFPRELELFLELAGFDLLRLGRFPDFEKDPDENSWNVFGIARATL